MSIKNRFFDLALQKASGILGKRGRLILLLGKMTHKLTQVNWKDTNSAAIKDQFYTLGRISKAYATGRYREVPWKTMLLIVAAIIYFVNPFDLLPDLIPVAGLTDDVAILLAVYKAATKDVEKFLTWEKSQVILST